MEVAKKKRTLDELTRKVRIGQWDGTVEGVQKPYKRGKSKPRLLGTGDQQDWRTQLLWIWDSKENNDGM